MPLACKTVKLKPFQKEFIRAVESPDYDVVVLSGPRTLGKTFLAGRVLSKAMTPGDVLYQPGKEVILGASTLEQARMTYSFIRNERESAGGYRWIDSTTRLGATHIGSNTKLRAISSNAKSSLGLVNVPLVCLDEPGALELAGGSQLADSLFTALGKVGSPLKLVLVGTLAPMATAPGHWWYDLVTGGNKKRVHVQYFHGELEGWDTWPVIRKANPLVMVDPASRRRLLQERDEARLDPRLRARFLSYRLNIPSRDESEMLLTTTDFGQMCGREVPAREGPPIVAVDLGGGRSWSAATAVWQNGRVEAIAVAPGLPSLEVQEKRDRVSAGTYRSPADHGLLHIAEGLQVQPVAAL